MKFLDLPSVENHLNSLINYEHAFPLGGARDRPKLEPTLQAVERLNLSLRLPNGIHIAGTKGKGSVVSFLEAIFQSDSSALSFTSPHLTSFTERIRWNGNPLTEDIWRKAFSDIIPALNREPTIALTYFEMTWITFLWAVRELKPDVSIVEAGLGGKWDATNVLEHSVAVLTTVDYDHTDVLGNTLTEIATDKSGIIKRNARVIISRQPDEPLWVYRRVVAEQGAQAYWMDEDYRWVAEDANTFRYEDHVRAISGLTLVSPGSHQRDNAATAMCTALGIQPGLSPDSIRTRLSHCVVPGRQQLLPGTPDVLVDVAHNPVSFRALAETLRSRFADRRICAVIGMMKNKDARSSLAALQGLIRDVYVVELNNPRSAKPVDLAEIASSFGMNATFPSSVEDAFIRLHHSRDYNLGLIAGSFYLAGDYLLWRKRAGIA